jgi:hypothetical protein
MESEDSATSRERLRSELVRGAERRYRGPFFGDVRMAEFREAWE